MSFLLNNAPVVHSRNMADTTWDSTCNSKFTVTKGYPLKSSGDGVSSEQMHMPGAKLAHFINMQNNAAKGFVESKSSVADVSNPGSVTTSERQIKFPDSINSFSCFSS